MYKANRQVYIQNQMIAQQQDPLRFLKPRRKQFHLTPTKPPKGINAQKAKPAHSQLTLNQSSQYSFDQQIQRRQQNQIKNPSSKTISQSLLTIQNKPKQTKNETKSKLYNPMRYFSSNIEIFLQSKRGKSIKETPVGLEVEASLKSSDDRKQMQRNSNFMQSIPHDLKDYVIPLATNQQKEALKDFQSGQNTMRLQDYFYQKNDRQQTPKQTQIHKQSMQFGNNLKAFNRNIQTRNQNQKMSKKILKEQLNSAPSLSVLSKIQQQQSQPLKNKFPSNEKDSNLIERNNREMLGPLQEDEGRNDLKLEECPTCSRKFNPNSYEKHVKVCEKVFFNKRKQFSSQKQRSLSSKRK